MTVLSKAIAIFLVLAIPAVLASTWFFNSIGLEPQSPYRFLGGMFIGWACARTAISYYFANED